MPTAGSRPTAAPARVRFELADRRGEARVQVLGEDRELTARDGAFEDDFTGYGVHLYRIGAP